MKKILKWIGIILATLVISYVVIMSIMTTYAFLLTLTIYKMAAVIGTGLLSSSILGKIIDIYLFTRVK